VRYRDDNTFEKNVLDYDLGKMERALYMRLFLNVRNPSGDTTVDPDGEDFDTLDQAEAEAKATARDLMADALRSALPVGLDRVIEVVDDAGEIVASVTFEEAIIR
jgi:hypothetical protein